MALAPGKLEPPVLEQPIADDGQHTRAWSDYHQNVADALAKVHLGVTDGSEAKAGEIGEYLTASGGPLSIANNTPTNIATLPLTAGDYDVWGQVAFTAAGTTHPTQIGASISTVSATLQQATTLLGAAFTTGATLTIGTAGSARVNVAAATTAYLVGFSTFTTAGMTASGTVYARRAR